MLSRANSPLGPLPEGWCVKYLSEIASKIGSGSTPRGGESAYISQRENFAFVRSQQVYDFYFEKNDLRFITDNDAEKLKGVHLKENDLLLNITGDGVTFSRCCIVPKEILPAAVNQHVSVIRLDQEKCLPGYLLSYLCHPKIKEYIASFNAGGSRRAITKQHIESFEIPLPPLYVQEIIQRVAFGLLSKIQLNHQINQTLEKMAQAFFKSWFVDFEPVKAKIAARERWQALQPENEPASPVCYAAEFDEPSAVGDLETTMNRAAMQAIAGKTGTQLDALRVEDPERYQELYETAALFPSAMQASELGEIPEGWECSIIGAEVEIKGGGTPPTQNKEYWEGGGISWTSPKDLSGAKTKILISTEKKITQAGLEKISSGLLPTDTVLMSSRAPVGYLALAKIPVAINQGYIAMICKKRLQPEYVLQWVESVMDDIKQLASGSTFAEISKKSFRSIPIVVPAGDLVTIFCNIARAKCLSIELNLKNSNNLSEIRDALLPKLLSGELEV